MDCYEFEGKKLLERCGIPIPRGEMASSDGEAAGIFKALAMPCVVKAQVLSGKRGKAGGIRFAETEAELGDNVGELLGSVLRGEKVRHVLVEEKLDIRREFYLGATIDPLAGEPVLMFSGEGGMDIEELVATHPDKLVRMKAGRCPSMAEWKAALSRPEMGLEPAVMESLLQIMGKLVALFYEADATTVEINPLALCGSGRLIAADAKIVIDDSALYRQKGLGLVDREFDDEDASVRRAREHGLAFVPLDEDGDIGTIAGGAGLALATMDTVRHYGGKPANFLDVGGGVTERQMTEALRIVASRKGLRGIIINVFGGINNCAVMASGIDKVLEEEEITPRIVVKMRGHSQEEGWGILKRRKIPVIKYGTTEEAVKLLLSLIGGTR
jgi:succinyl-CoA synthetase beta subunit